MRSIDIIKDKLDSAFQEYGNTTLCEIKEVIRMKGSHTYARALPFGTLSHGDGFLAEDNTMNVSIINRPPGWIEEGIIDKYYIIALSLRPNKPSCSIGFLVRKTIVDTFDKWPDQAKEDATPIYIENIIEAKNS